MRQGGKSNRGKTAGSQSQLLPAVGHEALPVGSSSAFFKATGAWGNGSWACPHLPFSCQQPWPRSHFSDGPVNESVTSVEKQESGVNNKRANCTPHLPWKSLSSKEMSLHKANSPPPENMEQCLIPLPYAKEYLCSITVCIWDAHTAVPLKNLI